MNMTKRERWIAVTTLLVLGAFALDSWLLTPLLNSYRSDLELRDQLAVEARNDEMLYNRRERINQGWSERMTMGVALSPTDAENKLLSSLESWSAQSALKLSAMRSERVSSSEGLKVIRCHLTAYGSMRSLTKFIWQIAEAAQPVSLQTLDISCPDDTKGELSVEMEISSVCLDIDSDKEGR